MADRSFHKKSVQGVNYVEYDFQLRTYGATHPVFVEGNASTGNQPGASSGQSVPVPTGSPTGSYLTVQRGVAGITGASGSQNPLAWGVTGTTGSYVFRTRDPFVALVSQEWQLSFFDTSTGKDYKLVPGQAFQNADETWTIPVTCYLNSAGTYAVADLPADAGNRIHGRLVFRNTQVKP